MSDTLNANVRPVEPDGSQVTDERAIVVTHELIRRLREYPRHARTVAALERRGR